MRIFVARSASSGRRRVSLAGCASMTKPCVDLIHTGSIRSIEPWAAASYLSRGPRVLWARHQTLLRGRRRREPKIRANRLSRAVVAVEPAALIGDAVAAQGSCLHFVTRSGLGCVSPTEHFIDLGAGRTSQGTRDDQCGPEPLFHWIAAPSALHFFF